ncbi:MAG: M15 family metallopeptidase [Candidatus Competibacteraceae bacterium]|nr:M15 family metallopeptidase [Candidatus Competibacteraceae bacterium]
MNNHRFSPRSWQSLQGVTPKLIAVTSLALKLSPIDFIVTEGLRTRERQTELVKQGASRTMNSKHILGRAVDVAALDNGRVSWNFALYEQIAKAFKEAAASLGVDIEWGGDWKSFRDGVHFQLKDGE